MKRVASIILAEITAKKPRSSWKMCIIFFFRLTFLFLHGLICLIIIFQQVLTVDWNLVAFRFYIVRTEMYSYLKVTEVVFMWILYFFSKPLEREVYVSKVLRSMDHQAFSFTISAYHVAFLHSWRNPARYKEPSHFSVSLLFLKIRLNNKPLVIRTLQECR